MKPNYLNAFIPIAIGILVGNFRLKSAGTADKSNPLARAFASLLLRLLLHKIKSEIGYQYHQRRYKREKPEKYLIYYRKSIIDAARGLAKRDGDAV